MLPSCNQCETNKIDEAFKDIDQESPVVYYQSNVHGMIVELNLESNADGMIGELNQAMDAFQPHPDQLLICQISHTVISHKCVEGTAKKIKESVVKMSD